jgi:single-strand DNA-binding protein
MFNDKFTVSIKGNIGFMETKILPSGTEVTNFSIAVNDSYKDRLGNKVEETNYINCSAYSKTSELLNRFCKQGTRLLIENQPVKFGKDKDTGKSNGLFNVVVQSFEVLKNGKPKEDNQQQSGYQQQQAPQQNNNNYQQRPQGINQQQPNPRDFNKENASQYME